MPDDVRVWFVRLEEELATWPDVSTRPMFGMLGIYRDRTIFAALPRTRAWPTPSSIIFKFNRETAETKRARAALGAQEGNMPGAGWLSFELASPDDITRALGFLELAYQLRRVKPYLAAKDLTAPR